MKSKKAVSEMVAYVLLIVIAVGISVLVYSFLKDYAGIKPETNCPANVAIAIDNYGCTSRENEEHSCPIQFPDSPPCTLTPLKMINITLRNTGTFNIDGYIIRIKAEKAGKISTISYNSLTDSIKSKVLNIGNVTDEIIIDYTAYNKITDLEVEPYRLQNNQVVLCKDAVISEPIISDASTGC